MLFFGKKSSRKAFLRLTRVLSTLVHENNLVPRGCIPFGQHQGSKTSGIINVKMLANRNLIGYYILPEVYEKEMSKQEIKILRMLLLDVFDHVRDGQWERNLKMGDQTNKESKYSQIQIHVREDAKS